MLTCRPECETQNFKRVINVSISYESHTRLLFGEKLADTKLNARYFLGLQIFFQTFRMVVELYTTVLSFRSHICNQAVLISDIYFKVRASVLDPEVFRTVNQSYGSGSFHHQAKIVRKIFILLFLTSL